MDNYKKDQKKDELIEDLLILLSKIEFSLIFLKRAAERGNEMEQHRKELEAAFRAGDFTRKEEAPLLAAEIYGELYSAAIDNAMQRQAFHFSPPVGWMNDPNGFSYYNGKIQLFYQYNPYSIQWDTMHWGHATSTDFVKWERQPVALAPDQPYDGSAGGGCFSGSAIEYGGKYWLVYTGVGRDEDTDMLLQTQCVASSDDGIRFRKIAENPVIAQGKGLPSSVRPNDFRDPKLWEKDGHVYMIVSAGNASDRYSRLLLFRSDDMANWQYNGTVFSTSASAQAQTGTMLECPDYFELDGTEIVMACPMDMTGHRNTNGSVYMAGRLNYDTGKFAVAEGFGGAREVDGGFDFYAPQTMLHPDGRRIMIAWMHCPVRPSIGSLLGYGYACAQTFPRELFVKDGNLHQRPVREIENYYRPPVSVTHTSDGETAFVPELDGTCMNLQLEFSPSDGAGATVFADGAGKGLGIFYRQGRLYLDRSAVYPGSFPDSALITSVPAPLIDGKVKIRLLLDKISAEVFVADGRYAMTANVTAGGDHCRTLLRSEETLQMLAVKNEIVV